jgi:FAD:protein FMN transferase
VLSRRLFLIVNALGLLAAGFTPHALAGDLSLVELTGDTMGTYYRILLTKRDGQKKGRIQEGIDRFLNRIEDQMSTWRPDSELSRFNKSESTDWIEVSPETAFVVAESLRIAEQSGGAFDPTVSPLIDLWSFGAEHTESRIPTDEEISAAKQKTGWAKVTVRATPPSLKKSQPEIQLNLSAIAKGYGVDAVSDWLVDQGETNHLVEIGGEDRASGLKADGTAWRIGVQAPSGMPAEQSNGPIFQIVELNDRSIATSGDYQNYFEVDGKRYSHTIDPTAGRPITHDVASVSVLADSCMAADGWATALTVLGPEKGMELARAQNLAVLILVRGDSKFDVLTTDSWTSAKAATKKEAAEPLSWIRTFLAAGIIFVIALTGMAVGVIFSNRRIKGSCGGLANMPGQEGSACDLCENPSEECQQEITEGKRGPGECADDVRDHEHFEV